VNGATPDQCLVIAERIRRAVASLVFQVEATPIKVTISLGLAYLIPDPALTLDVLINNADQALYLAKQQGRNCVVAWSALDHRVNIATALPMP